MHLPLDPATGNVISIPKIPRDITAPVKRVPVPNYGTKVYARWDGDIPTPPPVPSPPTPPGDDSDSGNGNGNSGNGGNSSNGHSSSGHSSSHTSSPSSTHSPGSTSNGSTNPTNNVQNTLSGAQSDHTAPAPPPPPGTSSKKSGLSPAIIGAIAGGIALVIFVIGFFFTRKWYQKRRAGRRVHNPNLGWSGAADEKKDLERGNSVRTSLTSSHWSFHGNGGDTNSLGSNLTAGSKKHIRQASVPNIKRESLGAKQSKHRSSASMSVPLKPLILVTPPDGGSPDLQESFSFNEPVAPPPAIVHPHEDTSGPYIPARMTRPFVRSMPDELSAQVGDKVGILKEYDDGWSLCVTLNAAGAALEPGMVPTECLEKLDGAKPAPPVDTSAPTTRAKKRESSLNGQPLRRDSLPA